jgi:hypothetical protein
VSGLTPTTGGHDILRRAFPIARPDGEPVWGNHWRRVAARQCLACWAEGHDWSVTIIWDYTGPLEHRRVICKPDVIWAECARHYVDAHIDPTLGDLRGL